MARRASALILLALIALLAGSAAFAFHGLPPVCDASISGSGETAIINGSAADGEPSDLIGSGIVSVVLDPSSTNLTLTVTPFTPGTAPPVTFTLALTVPATRSGKGTAIVTDDLGNMCRVGVAYTPIAAGVVSNTTVFSDPGQGVKLHILNGFAPMACTAVVASSPPGADDLPHLPASYGFTPSALILDLDSPTSGLTRFAYDINIPNTGDLRLGFRRFSTGCDLEDITESVEDIGFDPRVKGSGPTSRVQLAMASTPTPRTPTCDPVLSVPTLTEWGLCVTTLLMLTGLTFLLMRRPVPAGEGRGGARSIAGATAPLFVPAVFGKTACGTLALAGVGLAAAELVFDSIRATDLAGALLSALIFAYVIHLWIVSVRGGAGD